MTTWRRLLLPAGVDAAAGPLLVARALRAFADGYMAILLPAYLLALGLGTLEVGVVATATMFGSALATVAVGAWGHRFRSSRLLRGAALLMVLTGVGFAAFSSFWPLLVVAFVGTLNPSSGDVSVFLPLEHARLAGAARGHVRTALFERYSLLGAVAAALGALAAAVPAWLIASGVSDVAALRAMFVLYGAVGLLVWQLYRRQPPPATEDEPDPSPPAPLGPSRAVVVRLAALFSVDAFAGGLVVNSLMALWLLERFGFSLAQAGAFFFWAGLLSALSQLAAPVVARRFGLLNTMAFTHIPASLCVIAVAFAPNVAVVFGLMFVRALLSNMDVPARSSYVMAIVTPAERAAAAGVTNVPRSLASAFSPALAGLLYSVSPFAWPLVIGGSLKTLYDLLLLWRFQKVRPPEEA